MPSVNSFIVGAGFRKHAVALILTLREGETVTLQREPHNPHDPNAVAVYVRGGWHVGYLPREHAVRVAQMLDSGEYAVSAKYAGYGMGLRITRDKLGPGGF